MQCSKIAKKAILTYIFQGQGAIFSHNVVQKVHYSHLELKYQKSENIAMNLRSVIGILPIK
jgi:hypothetical protein